MTTNNTMPFWGTSEWPDYLRKLFEEEPKASYFSHVNQLGQSPAMQRYYQGAYPDVSSKWIGVTGQQMSAGQIPTDINTYLQGYPFYEEWMKLAPSMKGTTTGRYAPQTTWRFY